MSGMRRIFPEAWRRFAEYLPAEERHDLLAGYYRRLTDPSPDVHMPAARVWSQYEGACSTLRPNPETVAAFGDPRVALGLARIEAHYFMNRMFMPEGQLLYDAHRIADIPGVIVQGRYDIVCPIASADELARAWPDQTAAADEALARLAAARAQLRDHLAEAHGYVRQGREDLEGLRDSVGRELERLREQEQAVHAAQDAHRLSVAGFRQQLIDWQGQIDELRRSLASGEERLGRRQLEVEEQARRESLFEQSVLAEKTRGDALAKRFEEALKQARQEPVSKPTRDFDLD